MSRNNADLTARRGRSLGLALALSLVAAPLLAAPVIDQAAGSWFDTFGTAGVEPGTGLASLSDVVVEGGPNDGELTLAPVFRESEERVISQTTWRGGPANLVTTDLTGNEGFEGESANMLWENFGGELVLTPLIFAQDGLSPFKNPVSPIRTSEAVEDYYGFGGASSNAPYPSSSRSSFFFFHRDNRRGGALSLVATHNERNSTGSSEASVWFDIEELPDGSALVVSDDAGEVVLDGNRAEARWRWFTCCSDGMAIELGSDTFIAFMQIIGGVRSGNDVPDAYAAWHSSYFYRFFSETDSNGFGSVNLRKPTTTDFVDVGPVIISGNRQGALESSVFDLGALEDGERRALDFAAWDLDISAGGAFELRLRSSDDPVDIFNVDWSAPVSVSGSSIANLLPSLGRYVQYRVDIGLPSPAVGGLEADPVARLREVRIGYVAEFEDRVEPVGVAVSADITPAGRPVSWGALEWEGSVPPNGSISIDVISAVTGQTLVTDAAPATDLRFIDAGTHTRLRLRATFETLTGNPDERPFLESWSVTWEPDSDFDGVPDDEDNCPDQFNPDQSNNDGDPDGDACDADDDNDDEPDITDNCELVSNPDQADTDGDGEGDACDQDADGDGVIDSVDNCPGAENTNQANADSDQFGDACDNCPDAANNGQQDTDNDGRGDACDLCPGVVNEVNADGDPVPACAGDCDDGNPNVYPGAEEVCDGADNDCDGDTDGPFDADGDGVTTCAGDCDDTNRNVRPGASEVCDGVDNDCDGGTDVGAPVPADACLTQGVCEGSTGACVNGAIDCGYPVTFQASEFSCDGLDNDCDGVTDLDGPCDCVRGEEVDCGPCEGQVRRCEGGRFGACLGEGPSDEVCDGLDNNCDGDTDEGFDFDDDGLTSCDGDCNDGDPLIRPGRPELCDGVDNNCDGDTDEGCFCLDGDRQRCGTNEGECSSGIQRCEDGEFGECEGAVGPNPEACDGLDNDCDSFTDEDFDQDGDLVTTCGGDCDDGNAAIRPEALEICDGVDNDCDGVTDPGCACRQGDERPCGTSEGSCEPGVQICGEDGTFSDCIGAIEPRPETCNSADDDCDGFTDEDFDEDGDGVTSCGGDCDDGDGDVTPGREEVCDGKDNDCDGETDLGCPCVIGDRQRCGLDEGECSFGVQICETGGFGPCIGATEPQPERCDLADNDCDGVTDEDFDRDNDGVTSCAGDCEDDNPDVFPGAEEVCDRTDNDCDGFTDVIPDLGIDVCGGCQPGEMVPCGTDEGACSTGMRMCGPDGELGECEGAVGPVPEVCDGADNDCDGDTDEDFDADADDFASCDGDCDDNNPSVNPRAEEVCDGVDNTCDGNTDPGCACSIGDIRDCGTDEGTCEAGVQICNPLTGGWSDCNGAVGPEGEACDELDNDCDGLTDEGFDADTDGVTTCEGDCDDQNGTVFPGARELCDDLDNNCNGEKDEGCGCTPGETRPCGSDGGDCEAGIQTCGPDGQFGECEGGSEVRDELCNGIDDDCDGLTDEDFDEDGDGVSVCGGDCDDENGAVFPGAPEECDGEDNNCDGEIDLGCPCNFGELRQCGLDQGECTPGVQICLTGNWGPCNGATAPGAEICDDLDNDCDGVTDEDFDQDGDGSAVCFGDCDDGNPDVRPGLPDVCDDLDNDCDGDTDPGCICEVGDQRACGSDVGTCRAGVQTCMMSPEGPTFGQCIGAVGPGIEQCDALDNDCDGRTDEDFDNDGDGIAGCAGDCNDNDRNVFPGAPEACDGADNNCDGSIDAGCPCFPSFPPEVRDCGLELGACTPGIQVCNPLTTTWTECNGATAPSTEICDDVDNDCDGDTDEGFDEDNDGVPFCAGDCDDGNATVFPGAAEICDGIDNDCSGVPTRHVPARTVRSGPAA